MTLCCVVGEEETGVLIGCLCCQGLWGFPGVRGVKGQKGVLYLMDIKGECVYRQPYGDRVYSNDME